MDSDKLAHYVAEHTAIVAAFGVARTNIALLEKNVLSPIEFEAVRAATLRDFDLAMSLIKPGHPAAGEFEERRSMLEAAWTPKGHTTEEPRRRS